MVMREGMTPEEAFAGGVAVITGAGAGIGAGLARRAAGYGMTVAVVDVAEERATSVTAEIRNGGGQAHAMVADVSKPDALDRLATEVAQQLGDVRLLINNAGIETVGYSWEIPTERWEATLDINIHGVVHGVRAFLPRMIASGREAWVANLSSVGAFSHMPVQTAYIVTKHAVQAFTECLALEIELAGAPIHVSAVIPGMVRTSIFDPTDADQGALAVAHRSAMRAAMAADGMDLDKACQRILEQIAAGAFWVSTQPRMTRMFLDNRSNFFKDQPHPSIAPELKPLFGHRG